MLEINFTLFLMQIERKKACLVKYVDNFHTVLFIFKNVTELTIYSKHTVSILVFNL